LGRKLGLFGRNKKTVLGRKIMPSSKGKITLLRKEKYKVLRKGNSAKLRKENNTSSE